MDDIQRMLIERECERLVVEYCHFVDHGEASKIAGQFTDDGVWTSPDNTMSGRAEIEAGFLRREKVSRRKSRHVCTNLLVNVVDEQTADGVVYLTLYRHDDTDEAPVRPSDVPDIVGEYRDRFVKTAAGWRFQRREIAVDFARKAGG